MYRKIVIIASLFILLLAACADAQTAAPTPIKIPTSASTTYPYPAADQTQLIEPTPYPDSSNTINQESFDGAKAAELNPYPVMPEDATLTRGEVYLELKNARVFASMVDPAAMQLYLIGNLPSPCYQPRIAIAKADDQNHINVEVYAVITNPDRVCAQVLQPFEATVSLGNYPTGKYGVYINNQLFKEFGK